MKIKKNKMTMVIIVEMYADIVFLLIPLIKNKLMQLMMVQATNVIIIGLLDGLNKKMIVHKIMPILKNKARKERTPFFPPINVIKINKIAASNNRTFMNLLSFFSQNK